MFLSDYNATVYYLPGRLGWGTTFAGLPTAAVQTQFTCATNSGRITIAGYTGSGGVVSIPAVLNGLLVTSIGTNAFQGLESPASVTIPASVTTIGDAAFESCTALTNATLANGVTSIGNYAFAASGLSRITIPNGVTNIGYAAFSDCNGLTSVTIPGSVTSIGDDAFYFCASLTGVYFQGNTPAADASAFAYDQNTTAYYLPGSTGWSNTFAGLPAVLWNPLIQANSANFDMRSDQFWFNITGTANIPILVEACTNLACPVWTPRQSLMLTNGLCCFSEPIQTNNPGRYYRIRSP